MFYNKLFLVTLFSFFSILNVIGQQGNIYTGPKAKPLNTPASNEETNDSQEEDFDNKLPKVNSAQERLQEKVDDEKLDLAIQINSMDDLDNKIKLSRGNTIAYRVVEEGPEYVKRLQVTDSGELQVPHIGFVKVEKKTCKQVARIIKKKLDKEYFYDSTVIVNIISTSNKWDWHHSRQSIKKDQWVHVYGEVTNFGKRNFPKDGDFMLSTAVQWSGPTRYAKLRAVKLKRVVNGRMQNWTIDIKKVIEKGAIEKDVKLKHRDVITVPKSMFVY